jgi:hypothetical protein
VGKLATAVDYLHSGAATGNPVLHRDIKPSNVIVSTRGPVLVDFGFTRVLSDQPMTVVGTPYYMAPEVLGSGQTTPATDRYALGATAYFALTGLKPNPSDRAEMVAALEAIPGADTNPALANHVLSMMDVDASRRPLGAIAWAQQLVAGAVSTPMTQHRPPAAEPTAPTVKVAATSTTSASPAAPRKRKLLWAAIAVLVLGGAAATAAVVLGGGSEGSVAPSETTLATTAETSVSTSDTAPDTTSSPATVVPAVVDVKIPNVVGKSTDEALALLAEMDLSGDVQQVEGPGPYEVVSKASPGVGKTVESGSTVVLTVPVPPTLMPDVTGSLLNSAKRQLESYGIEVTIQDVLQEGTDQQILDQTPKAGEPFSAAVTLTVSRQPAIVYVADIQTVDTGNLNRLDTGSAQVNGTVYTRSVLLETYSDLAGFAEYDLARKYLRLRGLVGPIDTVNADAVYKIEIFLDGSKAFEQTLGLGQTAPIDIDLTSVLRLRLQVTRVGGRSGVSTVAFADLQILGDPKVVPATTTG